MTFTHLLASILACYVTSLMVSKLSGPGHIFSKLRRSAKGQVKEGIQCPYCSSVWIAFILTTYSWLLWPFPLPEAPLWALAIAGGSSLLHATDKI